VSRCKFFDCLLGTKRDSHHWANRRDRPGDLNLRAAAAGKIFKNAPTKKARMCSHEPSLFPCSSFSPPTTDALQSSRLRFMRSSQPKQIVKTPGGVQSHAYYRKINDISIGDFSQTRNTIPWTTISCDRRRILCFYSVFPYLVSLIISWYFQTIDMGDFFQ